MNIWKVVALTAVLFLVGGLYFGNGYLIIMSSMLCVSELTVLRVKDVWQEDDLNKSWREGRAQQKDDLLFELYQICGQLNANPKVLDNIYAALEGHVLPHKTLLPYEDDE